jgi:Co/Zn/Cd efflux system component
MSASRSQTPATTAASAQDESLPSVLVALAANTTIAIAKGAAAALTGSPALLAETLHTVADAGNEVFLYIAIRRSRRPADASHPFGYGPERYFWALLAAKAALGRRCMVDALGIRPRPAMLEFLASQDAHAEIAA